MYTIAGTGVAAMAMTATSLLGMLAGEVRRGFPELPFHLLVPVFGAILTVSAALMLVVAERRREPGETVRLVGWLGVSVGAILSALAAFDRVSGFFR